MIFIAFIGRTTLLSLQVFFSLRKYFGIHCHIRIDIAQQFSNLLSLSLFCFCFRRCFSLSSSVAPFLKIIFQYCYAPPEFLHHIVCRLLPLYHWYLTFSGTCLILTSHLLTIIHFNFCPLIVFSFCFLFLPTVSHKLKVLFFLPTTWIAWYIFSILFSVKVNVVV